MNPNSFLVASLTSVLFSSLNMQGLQSQQEGKKEHGTLKWYAEQAKANGKKEVTIPAPIPMFQEVESLDAALKTLAVIVGQPIRDKVYTLRSSTAIGTWYKFKILEVLSKPLQIPNNALPDTVPTDLLPLADDEVLISTASGRVLVDEVTISSQDNYFPPYKMNQRYLLFLSLDSGGRRGTSSMGPCGVFRITPQNRLEPVSRTGHPVQAEIASDFENSLDRLAEQIKLRSRK